MFEIFAETLVLGDNFIFLSDALSQNARSLFDNILNKTTLCKEFSATL